MAGLLTEKCKGSVWGNTRYYRVERNYRNHLRWQQSQEWHYHLDHINKVLLYICPLQHKHAEILNFNKGLRKYFNISDGNIFNYFTKYSHETFTVEFLHLLPESSYFKIETTHQNVGRCYTLWFQFSIWWRNYLMIDQILENMSSLYRDINLVTISETSNED